MVSFSKSYIFYLGNSPKLIIIMGVIGSCSMDSPSQPVISSIHVECHALIRCLELCSISFHLLSVTSMQLSGKGGGITLPVSHVSSKSHVSGVMSIESSQSPLCDTDHNLTHTTLTDVWIEPRLLFDVTIKTDRAILSVMPWLIKNFRTVLSFTESLEPIQLRLSLSTVSGSPELSLFTVEHPQ